MLSATAKESLAAHVGCDAEASWALISQLAEKQRKAEQRSALRNWLRQLFSW